MSSPSRKSLLSEGQKRRIRKYKAKMTAMKKKLEAKAEVYENSHSLLWVWEFSKKAVLICFGFYIVVQVYSMVAMWYSMDFTSLPVLIQETAMIVRDCVFAYLIKAGLENIGKIWFEKRGKRLEKELPKDPDEPMG